MIVCYWIPIQSQYFAPCYPHFQNGHDCETCCGKICTDLYIDYAFSYFRTISHKQRAIENGAEISFTFQPVKPLKGLCHAILVSFKKAKKCLGIN